MTPAGKLQALLFYKSAPQKRKDIIELLQLDEATLVTIIEDVTKQLAGTGLALVQTDTELALTTDPAYSELIEEVKRSDMKKDIGKAGAETLAIILYRGPISRGEIDRIRGVNSGYILRNLTMRDLITRTDNKKRVEYQITTSLLRHLGVTNKQDLPGYTEVMSQLEVYEQSLSETD